MTDSVAAELREEYASSRRNSSWTSLSDLVDAVNINKQKYDSPFDASLAAAKKHTQQEKLWGVFATYALQLSSEDPTRMRIANVIKLLQDCGVIEGSHSEEAKMIEKEVSIVCESSLKSHSSERDGTKKLNFTAFLALLLYFAKMVGGCFIRPPLQSGDQDPSRAYDSLVQTYIERQLKPRLNAKDSPHMSCRYAFANRIRVPLNKEIEECKKVLVAFDDPLTKIFAFYASVTHAKLEKLEPKTTQQSPTHMGYTESMAFGRMYGIIALGMLTTTEFSSVYIDSLAKAPVTEYDRVLTYDGFCELLVRLSRKICHEEFIPSDKKLKGLFQLMWLACASSSPRALKITDVLKTDRLDVMKVFLMHFEKFWKKEQYEYVPIPPIHSSIVFAGYLQQYQKFQHGATFTNESSTFDDLKTQSLRADDCHQRQHQSRGEENAAAAFQHEDSAAVPHKGQADSRWGQSSRATTDSITIVSEVDTFPLRVST